MEVTPQFIAKEEWLVYKTAMEAAREAGVPFLVAGAFALGVYTGRWRSTKDIDLIVMPHHRAAIIQALENAGFEDFYAQTPYDRGWIYRSTRGGYIVDVIWRMANRRSDVDAEWFDHAVNVRVGGTGFAVIPPVELLWHKLYVLQRDRCDWPDVLNLLYAAGDKLDWARLLRRAGPDARLLEAVMVVFEWMCPGRINALPGWLRERFHLEAQSPDAPEILPHRASLLDTREWFDSVPEKHLPDHAQLFGRK